LQWALQTRMVSRILPRPLAAVASWGFFAMVPNSSATEETIVTTTLPEAERTFVVHLPNQPALPSWTDVVAQSQSRKTSRVNVSSVFGRSHRKYCFGFTVVNWGKPSGRVELWAEVAHDKFGLNFDFFFQRVRSFSKMAGHLLFDSRVPVDTTV
jgi:hypothetical protein